MRKAILLAFCLVTGCSYRFAQVTRQVCDHKETTRGVYSTYTSDLKTHWPQPMLELWPFEIPGIILNPLHWHRAEHEVCKRCGQKFCSVYVRPKWWHKVESK